ncbi:MAG TPA: insulinase family protein [Gemmatimonas aurantiaca]|uniref:Peptidase S16B family protein n=2 Tax=Gemmatimonas aurantiaca TaxID=173480 RepID=C1AEN4_GEMAT|nr:pitrilysin family protein [Gemmatimonas aurantiaca]BAH40961.1 peptidase S16B family protein [Gemmatimonas aurantiaca T-27]HCT58942.1 insulinase family protein [Gemmatimonas aurantiaca]
MHIPVESYRLPNGLQVVLSEDHTAPIVAVNLWYHVGSANERLERTGFAHLFEHMLFQGSANVEANEHFELVQRAGGTLNGSTWLDRTNYYETLPSHQLALALWLEADRMGRMLPAMTQQKLDTQRDVVKNERRWTVDNQPYGTWWERLPALVFPEGHPFNHSLIGSMEHLTDASLEDVAAFFQLYYTPDNAVLTVAGDFDRAEAMRLIEEYYGSIPRGEARPPLRDMTLPPVFGDTRREVVPDAVALPRLFVACRTPVFGTDGYYAASLASAVLGLRTGCRLEQSLVRRQRVASQASAFTYDLAKGSDMLVVDATAHPGVTPEQLEAAVLAELDAIHRDGVTEAEITRARALIETSFVTSMQSAAERADQLSRFATYFGDASLVNTQVDRYRAISAADVSALARERLGPDNRVLLMYVPAEADVDEADAVLEATA